MTRAGRGTQLQSWVVRFSHPRLIGGRRRVNKRICSATSSTAVVEVSHMGSPLADNLPEILKSVRTQPLFVMRLDVRPHIVVGPTPGGYRRTGVIIGGRFEGQRLSGEVLDGGSDWQTVRGDGAITLDVRLNLKTDDGALIAMTYRGIRHGPVDVMQRMEKGEVVDAANYYFRVNPLFETSATRYDWINRVVAVGVGHRRAEGPVYSVFEVL